MAILDVRDCAVSRLTCGLRDAHFACRKAAPGAVGGSPSHRVGAPRSPQRAQGELLLQRVPRSQTLLLCEPASRAHLAAALLVALVGAPACEPKLSPAPQTQVDTWPREGLSPACALHNAARRLQAEKQFSGCVPGLGQWKHFWHYLMTCIVVLLQVPLATSRPRDLPL